MSKLNRQQKKKRLIATMLVTSVISSLIMF